MADRVHHHSSLIYSVGTQVVALAEVSGESGRILHSRGSVCVALKASADLDRLLIDP